MRKGIKKYTLEELLQDDYFISSVLYPTNDNQEFWEFLVQSGNISAEELEEASFFIRSVQSNKEKLFRKEKEILWNRIEIENKKSLKKKVRTLSLISISTAACLVLLLSISTYLYYDGKSIKNKSNSFALLKDKINIDSVSNIHLFLSESEHVTFQESNTNIKYNEKGEVKVNTQTITKGEKQKKPADAYNKLIVPKGKHSTLLLSDGTKIWINGGSHVIYPMTFDANKREIYLNGEVFLDVAHNEACPFIVKTERMKVEVLGTSFNVKSYDKQNVDELVLVTGSIRLETASGEKAKLSPNQLFSCTSVGGSTIRTVDVYEYTSWKDGLLQFKKEKFSVILQRLSDYYGKSIQWDPEVSELTCSGKLDLKNDIEKVLNGLTKMIPVKFTKQNACYYFSMNP